MGVVNVIHVDETAIGGKRKYGCGQTLAKPHWLFGIVDKINHKIHLQFIPFKDKLNILPIINQHVRRGTQINSDGTHVYNSLSNMGFTHEKVIHKNKFVTQNGVHTSYIENGQI